MINPEGGADVVSGEEAIGAEGSEREKLIEQADAFMAEAIERAMAKVAERMRENPTVESGGRAFDIRTPAEQAVARVQKEVETAQALLEDATNRNDFYRMQAAADVLNFFQRKADALTHYAEIAAKFPKLSEVLVKTDSTLAEAIKLAEAEMDKTRN